MVTIFRNYTAVNPCLGGLIFDFENGRVGKSTGGDFMLDMVLNHCSTEHSGSKGIGWG